jgi:hypothetical protein
VGSPSTSLFELGPTLTRFGVPDALQDPVLQLHNTTSMMMLNDNWQNNFNWKNTQQVPFKLLALPPPNDLESAIVATLPTLPPMFLQRMQMFLRALDSLEGKNVFRISST